MLKSRSALLALLTMAATSGGAAVYSSPAEGDYVIGDFQFRSGQSLAEVRMHYRALGQPRRDAEGVVRNAVLVLHGTTGTGRSFCDPSLRASSSARASSSTRPATTSSFPTTSVTASPASRATGCTRGSPAIATWT